MVEARSRPRATRRGLEDCRRIHPDRRLTADGGRLLPDALTRLMVFFLAPASCVGLNSRCRGHRRQLSGLPQQCRSSWSPAWDLEFREKDVIGSTGIVASTGSIAINGISQQTRTHWPGRHAGRSRRRVAPRLDASKYSRLANRAAAGRPART